MEKIIILDFGGQTTQLISRRLRETGIYCEILPGNTDYFSKNKKQEEVKGIIFSGSPYSVYEPLSPKPDKSIFSSGIPILGICYGLQLLTVQFGGSVQKSNSKEFGREKVYFKEYSPLFKDVPDGFYSWMSHSDSVNKLGDGFSLIASSNTHPAAVYNSEKNYYGLQFHPEISHCDYGTQILTNFCRHICKISTVWDTGMYLDRIISDIRETVGTGKVLLLISGGVDSTVTAGILLKALPAENVFLMYIDTGLMRKNETSEIRNILKSLGAQNVQIIDAENRFLSELKGVSDPEKKRRIIGDLFIKVQVDSLPKEIGANYFLAQGTLYTDLIESGKGVGENAKVIKSHHNVRSPLVEDRRTKGLVIEPLSKLFKDEVRNVGSALGLREDIIKRHPFPGPGLGVRILGSITKEKCDILREADAIFMEELVKRNLYSKIWQAFCVLLPVKSVGVTGDDRKYGYVLALRAITSKDGMSADVFPFEMKDILEISSRITNTVQEIGRVVYDVSSKPPATIEWE